MLQIQGIKDKWAGSLSPLSFCCGSVADHNHQELHEFLLSYRDGEKKNCKKKLSHKIKTKHTNTVVIFLFLFLRKKCKK